MPNSEFHGLFITPEEYKALSANSKKDIINVIFKTDPNTIDYLAEIDDKVTLIAIACNSRTSQKTLAKLALKHNPDVQRRVAANKSTSAETLEFLAKNGNARTKYNVTQNPNVSPKTLHILADEKDPEIIRAILANPRTYKRTLKKFKSNQGQEQPHKK